MAPLELMTWKAWSKWRTWGSTSICVWGLLACLPVRASAQTTETPAASAAEPTEAPPETVVAPASEAQSVTHEEPSSAQYIYPAPPVQYAPTADTSPYLEPSVHGVSRASARLRVGAREHDGFFLRFSLGVGVMAGQYREAVDGQVADAVKTRGLGGIYEASIGGRIVDSVILHASAIAAGATNAGKRVGGFPDASYEVDQTLVILGGGVTYYFMPTNVFISGVIGLGGVSEFRDQKAAFDTNLGFGFSLAVGKEWWIGQSGQWGLGAALRYSMVAAAVDVAGVNSHLTAGSLGVAFSATLN